MKKRMGRITALILAMIMIVCILPVYAGEEQGAAYEAAEEIAAAFFEEIAEGTAEAEETAPGGETDSEAAPGGEVDPEALANEAASTEERAPEEEANEAAQIDEDTEEPAPAEPAAGESTPEEEVAPEEGTILSGETVPEEPADTPVEAAAEENAPAEAEEKPAPAKPTAEEAASTEEAEPAEAAAPEEPEEAPVEETAGEPEEPAAEEVAPTEEADPVEEEAAAPEELAEEVAPIEEEAPSLTDETVEPIVPEPEGTDAEETKTEDAEEDTTAAEEAAPVESEEPEAENEAAETETAAPAEETVSEVTAEDAEEAEPTEEEFFLIEEELEKLNDDASSTGVLTFDANGGTFYTKDEYGNPVEEIGGQLERVFEKGTNVYLFRDHYDVQQGQIICYTCTLDDAVVQRPGYILTGWVVEETGETYPSGYRSIGSYGNSYTLRKLSEDRTLTAVWKEAATITLDYNGGTYVDGISEQIIQRAKSWKLMVVESANYYSGSYRLPFLEKESFGLIGWKDTGTGTVYRDQEFIDTDHDMTLQAVWGTEITITLDPGEKSFDPEWRYWNSDVKEGFGADGKSRITGIAGRGFSGGNRISWYWPEFSDDEYEYYAYAWKLVGDPEGTIYKHGETFTLPEEDIVLEAVWGKKIRVDYDYDGGRCGGFLSESSYEYTVENPEYVIFQYDVNMNNWLDSNMHKDGYTFAGWRVQDSTDDHIYHGGDTYDLQEDTTFIAVWEANIAEGSCGTNTTWTLSSGGVLTISGRGTAIMDYTSPSIYGAGDLPTWYSYVSDIKKVVINDGVTGIGNCAFYNCFNMTEIIIPDSVNKIGNGVFMGCSSLTSINIPAGVTSLGDNLFSNCDSLAEISVDSGNPVYDSRDNCNAIIYTATNTLIYGFWNTVIPSSVRHIGYGVFGYCTDLTDFTIPYGVKTIGDFAFSNCSNLTSITIPASVVIIWNHAFWGCDLLSDVYYTGTEEEWNAIYMYHGQPFGNAEIHFLGTESAPDIIDDGVCGANLTWQLNREGTLTISGTGAMFDYSGDSSTGDSLAPWNESQGLIKNAVIENGVTSIGNYAFYGCQALTAVDIPDSVTSMGQGAFAECNCLKDITIPEGVTSIGRSTFYDCVSLTSIDLPDGLTSIGIAAFMFCDKLTSIVIPEGVTSISDRAFYWCGALTEITIPVNVTEIGEQAFWGCNLLTDVNYGGTEAQWNNIAIDSTYNGNAPLLNAQIHCQEALTGWVTSGIMGYYYYENGVMLTGWQLIDDVWYYLDPETGRLHYSWITINGEPHYFDIGLWRWASGWWTIGDTWVYFDPSTGALQTWVAIGNEIHYFDIATWKWATGWKKIDKMWYCFDSNGALQTWSLSGSNILYFDINTWSWATGWKQIDKMWYCFDSAGVLQTGWIASGSNILYFDLAKWCWASGWYQIDKMWYYFNPSTLALAGWVPSGKSYMYFDIATWSWASGWKQIGGTWYYFNPKTLLAE